jgi:hypothetical protein
MARRGRPRPGKRRPKNESKAPSPRLAELPPWPTVEDDEAEEADAQDGVFWVFCLQPPEPPR